MNIFQKIIFYLWFLFTLLLALMISAGNDAEQVQTALHNGLPIEGIITLVLGVPFLLFRSARGK